jgi:hypothetical protein
LKREREEGVAPPQTIAVEKGERRGLPFLVTSPSKEKRGGVPLILPSPSKRERGGGLPLHVLSPSKRERGGGVPLLKPSPLKRERGGVVLLIKKKKSSRCTFYTHRLSPLCVAAVILSRNKGGLPCRVRRRRKYSGCTLYACDLCCQHVAVVVSRRKGWVMWLPRCVRKEETKEKSRRTFYAHGVSRLWFATVNCC